MRFEGRHFRRSSRRLFFLLVIILSGCPSPGPANEPFTAPAPSSSTDTFSTPGGYTLVWSDEFDGTGIDLSSWSYETEANGWSHTWNGEWQRYTDNGTGGANASINNGVLVIRALKTSGGDGGYTSARMVTKGQHSFQYGIIAARMQLPYGQGMWPAFWLLGDTGQWPANGEMDVMEMIGGGTKDRDAHAAIHWDNNGLTSASAVYTHSEALADDWHYYEVEWTASSITMKFDGIVYFTHNISDGQYDEFRRPFYLLLNLAVGGGWPGPPDGTTVFPQYLYVDWVRVYQ